MSTLWFLAIGLIPVALWEYFALATGEVWTISRAYMVMADTSETIVAAMSILLGRGPATQTHFFSFTPTLQCQPHKK